MIEHVFRRASAARLVSAVLVATDDDRIASAVRAFGGAAVLTRADHVSGTDRIAEVVAAHPCRAVVNLQGDEPLIEPDTIDAAVAPMLADPSLEMSTVSRPLLNAEEFHNPNVVKVVTNLAGDALYFSRAPIPSAVPSTSALRATADKSAALVNSVPSAALVNSVPSAARAHMGLYVYRRDTLLRLAALPAVPLELIESLEQLRALAHGIRIRVVDTPHLTMAVDTPADLERVRSAVAALELVRSGGGPHQG